MKKVKRIIAGMAAAVMAFSTMSIGASAATYPFDLHYDYNDHYTNVTRQYWQTTVSTTTQHEYLDAFSRYYYSSASVKIYNSLSSTLQGSYTSAPQHKSDSFPFQILGTNLYIEAKLENWNTGTFANANGSFIS